MSELVVNQNLQSVGVGSVQKKLAGELEAINKKLSNGRISDSRKKRLLRHKKNILEKGLPKLRM